MYFNERPYLAKLPCSNALRLFKSQLMHGMNIPPKIHRVSPGYETSTIIFDIGSVRMRWGGSEISRQAKFSSAVRYNLEQPKLMFRSYIS